MKKKLILKITILVTFILFASAGVVENYISIAPINYAQACNDDDICDPGENSVNCPKDCAWAPPPKPGDVPDSFDDAVLNATDWILGFVGMIAVLLRADRTCCRWNCLRACESGCINSTCIILNLIILV